jgi:ribonuclease D
MARATRLLQVVRDVATTHEIGAEVLATRRDVEAIAFGSCELEASALARGWRRDLLLERLRAAM